MLHRTLSATSRVVLPNILNETEGVVAEPHHQQVRLPALQVVGQHSLRSRKRTFNIRKIGRHIQLPGEARTSASPPHRSSAFLFLCSLPIAASSSPSMNRDPLTQQAEGIGYPIQDVDLAVPTV